MAYDPDLTPLFEACSDQDLDPLVKYLVKPFTSGLKTKQEYIKNRKNPSSYIFLIVQELQLFGGNTIANAYRRIFGYRRKGISYKEILHDVAKKMKVKYSSTEGVDEIEGKLLIKVLDNALKRMDQNQKEALFEEFRKAGLKDSDLRAGVPLTVLFTQAGVQMTGFLAYRLAVIVANAVAKAMIGRGLTLAVNAALTRTLAMLTGPIGWVITGLWTVYDVAGPADRVTIPCVLHIAYLRKKKAYEALGGAIE